MIKKITRFLTTTAFILLISACSSSYISYTNGQLGLQINNSDLQLHGKQVKQQKENFSTLFLTQNLLRLDDDSIVIYEEARTDIQYQFEPTTPKSIAVIFDAKRVIKVYYSSLLYAFQVELKDNRILNVIATQGHDKKLQMVYGMSSKKLNEILKELDADAQPIYYQNVIDLSQEATPFMSRWSTWKVHFFPLVVPLRLIGKLQII
jgi:hypothetical protein